VADAVDLGATSDLFELDGEGGLTLLGGYSPTSGQHHFPLAPVCPYSGADDVEPARLPTTGTLWAWTAVTAAPAGYEGPVPYGFGVVELDCAPPLRVVTRLAAADPSALTSGQAMALVADRWDEVVTWAFAPVIGAVQ
jgi:uncharacterized protein